jgi:hypothetical protein
VAAAAWKQNVLLTDGVRAEPATGLSRRGTVVSLIYYRTGCGDGSTKYEVITEYERLLLESSALRFLRLTNSISMRMFNLASRTRLPYCGSRSPSRSVHAVLKVSNRSWIAFHSGVLYPT